MADGAFAADAPGRPVADVDRWLWPPGARLEPRREVCRSASRAAFSRDGGGFAFLGADAPWPLMRESRDGARLDAAEEARVDAGPAEDARDAGPTDPAVEPAREAPRDVVREAGPMEPVRELGPTDEARLLPPPPRSTDPAREPAVEEATEEARELAVDRAAKGTRLRGVGRPPVKLLARLVAVAELAREDPPPRAEAAPPLLAA